MQPLADFSSFNYRRETSGILKRSDCSGCNCPFRGKSLHPVEEGIVALLEPFIDTIVVCTMTAFVIILQEPIPTENAGFIASNQGGHLPAAMASVIPWFPYILSLVIFSLFPP